mmetsp:Transcript_39382/g.47752  ORF Transcript_39382/g.47752 Transcript_39382/m.47752 type:complete len:129 (-) Transcript_39382:209-595(-)|eukprot:CAMPEP_0197855240 /NCGR_PEP_ID=MMETSP1438-20131217/26233_1 /TAXON_ID=1461541 /ORGANISM="Pterosperma sp., Strain CCMP1384" /LENGTH=128 /DNA_ID=CAMNT_0043470277 /DNA_START=430 /DNA_END=816 /DNA_ORIENTATION=+
MSNIPFASRGNNHRGFETFGQSKEASTRHDLLEGVNDIQFQTDTLTECQVRAQQAESTGASILQGLYTQKEGLLRAKEDIEDAKGFANQAEGTMRNIGFRNASTKYMCYITAALMIACCILGFVIANR